MHRLDTEARNILRESNLSRSIVALMHRRRKTDSLCICMGLCSVIKCAACVVACGFFISRLKD